MVVCELDTILDQSLESFLLEDRGVLLGRLIAEEGLGWWWYHLPWAVSKYFEGR